MYASVSTVPVAVTSRRAMTASSEAKTATAPAASLLYVPPLPQPQLRQSQEVQQHSPAFYQLRNEMLLALQMCDPFTSPPQGSSQSRLQGALPPYLRADPSSSDKDMEGEDVECTITTELSLDAVLEVSEWTSV